jgi:thiol-disulfide isomerase/thioredoxin
MRTTAIILGVVVLIIGIGYLATSSDSTPPSPTTGTQEAAETETVTDTNNTEPTADADTEPTSAAATATPESTSNETASTGVYTEYEPGVLAASDAEHRILFFHATWCPSCRALDADIAENENTIPTDVAIYKVDFDTATELKQQYGVTTQHSVVVVNQDGTAVSDISHPRSLEGVLNAI